LFDCSANSTYTNYLITYLSDDDQSNKHTYTLQICPVGHAWSPDAAAQLTV